MSGTTHLQCGCLYDRPMDSSDRLKLLQLAMEEDDESARSSRSGLWDPPSEAELNDVIPEYTISKLIAIGGMGAVYRATDDKGQDFAIKVMPPQFDADPLLSSRFETEMGLLSDLDHDHIVRVAKSGKAEGGLRYIAMEYVNGGTLRGQRSLAEAIQIVSQICDGLDHAHEKQIIHRDLKPSNILLTDDGHVKIADFGLAKKSAAPGEVASLTLTGAQLGTPHYMAPEMLDPDGVVDARADIYSLGVILYQLLTGKIPVGRYEKASKLAGTPRSLDAVLNKAMAVDPNDRFQTVSELRRALERLALPPRLSRKQTFALFSIVAMLGIVGLIVLHFATQPQRDQFAFSEVVDPPQSLNWHSAALWKNSPLEHEEWASNRDFVASSGTHLLASIENQGKRVAFRGRSLRLSPGSELRLQGSAGEIVADSLILDGGTVVLNDTRPVTLTHGKFRTDGNDTGVQVRGNIEVTHASQILKAGHGIGPEIRSSISGSAPLIFGRPESTLSFILTGDTSKFSGGALIDGMVRVDSVHGLGTGPIQIEAGELRLSNLNENAGESPVTQLGIVTVSERGTMTVQRDTTVKSLTVYGKAIAPGEYNAASDLATHPALKLSATLTVEGTERADLNPYLFETTPLPDDAPIRTMIANGEWFNKGSWDGPPPPRIQYSGPESPTEPAHYRVPEGIQMSVDSFSSGLNYFGGQLCTLEKGSSLTFFEPRSTLVFPQLHLAGGRIRHRIAANQGFLTATLAGDFRVDAATEIDIGAVGPGELPGRLFLMGKISGNGDIVLTGEGEGYLVVGSEISGHSGNWLIENGTLGSLDSSIFENATVRLSGEGANLSALRLKSLRVKRVESSSGAKFNIAGGDLVIDEWIHNGEPVPPGIYRDHSAISNSVAKVSKVVVGFETALE